MWVPTRGREDSSRVGATVNLEIMAHEKEGRTRLLC